MSTWTRPKSVPVPTVWSSFEGRIERNGVKNTYWIQEITDEYKDQVIQYMLEEFVLDEPFCKYSKISEDPDVMKEFKNFWSETLKENLGLVCLTKDQDGVTHVAGMNCTLLGYKDDEKDIATNLDEKCLRVFRTLKYVKDQSDPFTKFNITEYLDGMGLYVLPKYRGEGLGTALLRAREPMCRAIGLKATLTLFTSKVSQVLAERIGFKDLCTVDYADLEKDPGLMTFPNIQEHTKSIRFMYLLYDNTAVQFSLILSFISVNVVAIATTSVKGRSIFKEEEYLIPVPTVWSRFEGKIVTNGKRRSYWIQDITDEYKDQIVNYMVEEFLVDEPLSHFTETSNNPEVKEKFRQVWINVVNHNLGLLCLTIDEDGKPTIAGVNCTTICTIYDEALQAKGGGKIFNLFTWLKAQKDAFSTFNITEYLDGMGLYVLREYRGEGLGLELLKAREPLCRACGLKASLTVFSSKFSQSCAVRAGFKDFFAIDYDKLEEIKPEFKFPNIQKHSKSWFPLALKIKECPHGADRYRFLFQQFGPLSKAER
ncbi:hypothetical protein Trydic_g22693 [Trypoxylus dichotomus]